MRSTKHRRRKNCLSMAGAFGFAGLDTAPPPGVGAATSALLSLFRSLAAACNSASCFNATTLTP